MQMFAYRNTGAGIALRQQIAMFELSAKFGNGAAARKWDPEVVMTPFKRIVVRACRVFKVSPADLRSARRSVRVSTARQFIYYWATRLTPMSLGQIGRQLGGRDHTTVHYGRDAYPKKRAKMGRHLRATR